MNFPERIMNSGIEMSPPRKRPPMGHGPQLIAPVRPMVPELSMFVPAGAFSDDLPVQVDPRPAESPVTKSKSSPTLTLTNPEKKSPKFALDDPEKVFDVLCWQNEQIAKLQNQLSTLLLSKDVSFSHEKIKSYEERSTQTEAPILPTKMDAQVQISFREESRDDSIQIGESASNSCANDTSNFEKSLAEGEQCGDILDQLERACQRGERSKEENPMDGEVILPSPSPKPDVLGDTVNKLRNIGISFINSELIAEREQARNPSRDERFRSPQYNSVLSPTHGHDFASWQRQHLLQGQGQGRGAQASSSMSYTGSITSETSLAINSAALKYLDDRQLSEMAKKSGDLKVRRDQLGQGQVDRYVTRYGLSENQLSMSTKRYLDGTPPRDVTPLRQMNRNEFGRGEGREVGDLVNRGERTPRDGRENRRVDVIENMTQLLQQPKFK